MTFVEDSLVTFVRGHLSVRENLLLALSVQRVSLCLTVMQRVSDVIFGKSTGF